jgi:hypothetical protein
VLHFKGATLNDYYGLESIAVVYERLAIDEHMRGFRSFYETGHRPGCCVVREAKAFPIGRTRSATATASSSAVRPASST